MKRNKPFTPYEFQIKTLKIEKAALTAERDRYKAERDELIERLIEAGNKLAEWIADEWMFTDNKVHNRDWHKWKDLIAEIRAGKGEG